MRNLSVYMEGGEKVIHLDEPIIDPNTMTLRHATVFWRYQNVTTDNNLVGSTTISPGYWDFEALRERLDSEGIVLSKNVPDRTCNVLSKGKSVNLRNFGRMLGFDRNTIVAADTKTKSPGPVDVLRGLRYINVGCDAVDIRESTDSDGGRSTILSTLPIVSYETLNSSATNYFDINSTVAMCSGSVSSLRFTVGSNVSNPVGADVLLSIVVE